MPQIKNPGADLRARYRLYLKFGIIISISLMIAAFKFSPKGVININSPIDTQELIKIEDVINTIQKVTPPELPKRPQIIEATIDETPEDIILTDNNLDQDVEVGPVENRPELHRIDNNDEKFYLFPDQYPEPVGGIKAIWEKVHYTEIAKKAGIEGTVIIEADIDKEGNVVDAKIVRSIGGGLDEVSLNAVKQTRFKPGMQRGRQVKVRMTIPIKFVLQ